MTDAGPGASGSSSGESSEPGSKGSGEASEPGSKGSGADKTFTQEQVDAFIAAERRRFGDYDSIKAKLAEVEAAGQTELERAQAQAKDADARASDAVRQRNALLVRSTLTAAAARAGALDPDVVVALLADGVQVDERGEISAEVDKLVEKLLEDKPYLKGSTTTNGRGSADQGTHSRQPPSGATPSERMDSLFRGGG